jgi:hypothetical protein
MRILRLIIVSIIVLFLVTTFVFALFPSHIRISRVISLPASKERTAAVIGDLKTWNAWNRFSGDTTLGKQVFSSPSSGAGAYMQTGRPRITLTTVSQDSIRGTWEQENGPRFTGGFNLDKVDEGHCTVEWYFDFYFSWYPWDKLKSMFYDKQLGPVMENSLVALKNYTGNQ